MTRLSIGILAYNESSSIATTIRSLFSQSIFRDDPGRLASVEVIAVPNGCTDDTAEVARQALATGSGQGRVPVHVGVRELARGSKVHAWNEFVHHIADQGATRLILMDGDIRLEHPNTLSNLLRALESNSEAFLSSPRAIKHIEQRPVRTPIEWLSIRLGAINRARPWGFAGCCYCVRADVARRIWLPEGMTGEDAFLNGMVVTDCCRGAEVYERVIRPADATVVFEAYTGIGKIYRVLRRQAVTRGTNAILWSYLWANSTAERHAGMIIRECNEADPEWFGKLIRDHVAKCGWWVMPKGVVTRRLRYLQFLKTWKAIVSAPMAIAGCVVDAVVHVAANRMIRRGQTVGLWEATRTTKL